MIKEVPEGDVKYNNDHVQFQKMHMEQERLIRSNEKTAVFLSSTKIYPVRKVHSLPRGEFRWCHGLYELTGNKQMLRFALSHNQPELSN